MGRILVDVSRLVDDTLLAFLSPQKLADINLKEWLRSAETLKCKCLGR